MRNLDNFAQRKITYHNLPFINQYIITLEVTMHNSIVMKIRQPLQDLIGHELDSFERHLVVVIE